MIDLPDTHRCLECEALLMNQNVFVCTDCARVKDWSETQ